MSKHAPSTPLASSDASAPVTSDATRPARAGRRPGVAVPAEALTASERTLPALLQHQADRFGDAPFLSIAGTAWRHRDAATAAARCGAALRRAGIERGDRVAVMCTNRIEMVEMFLGCGWIGAVSVPINTAAMSPQIAYVLADSGARLLVIEVAFTSRLDAAALEGDALRAIWTVGDAGGPPEPGGRVVDAHAGAADLDSGARSPAGGRSAPYPRETDTTTPAAMQPGDPLAILYTSGTTGPAKGVVCPHAQFHWWAVNTARNLGVGPDDALGTTLPLFHINALNTVGQAMVTGCRVAIEPRFSASGFWRAMHASGATVVYLLGAMVPMLLAQPPSAAERSHRIRVGLGPGVPGAAGRALRERTGIALIEGYGSTETNFVIATTLDTPFDGRMGRVQPGFDARVVDEQDEEVPPGVAGELVLRADAPFAFTSGYFNRPEETVRAWRNLWFHTGDRVVRDADGAFRFIDRLKDAIRRRGENISSYEVEQVLLGHPAVAVAAVFAVRSELAEDEVMAALVAAPGRSIEPAEIVAFCATRLPKFSIPRFLDIVADLPRTENGKVQKFRLRERGVGPATWDRAAAERLARPSPFA